MKRKLNERAKIIDYVVEMSVRRNGYSRQQVMNRTCTVGDLIDKLETFDRDTKIITEHDGGYTFGSVYTRDVDEVPVEEDMDENLKRNLKESAAENSVHRLLWDLATAIENLLEGWDNNLDGVDLNELDANKYYPFHESLDEVLNDVRNWAEEVEEEIGSNTFDAKGKIDTSHLHLFDSLKESKKLNETWAGEDVISDLVDRAKINVDEDYDVDDAVTDAIDTGLIYTKDIRTLAEHYDVLPDDSELISLFYEELFNDIYNEVSDYYDEVHGDDDEEIEEESFTPNRMVTFKNLMEAASVDYKAVNRDIAKLQKIYNKDGILGLTEFEWDEIKEKYPAFSKLFFDFYKNLESNDESELDANSTPIEDYWFELDDSQFKAVVDWAKTKKGEKPIKLLIKYDPTLLDDIDTK